MSVCVCVGGDHECAVRRSSEHTSARVCVRSAHFDAFAGRVARVRQFDALMADLAARKAPAVIVGGDFNTHNVRGGMCDAMRCDE